MINIHLLKNSSTIVCNSDFTIGINNHLIHALRTERSAEDVGDGLGSEDVGLVSFSTTEALLLTLVTENDEGLTSLCG